MSEPKVHEELPTYDPAADAVAFWPGNMRHCGQDYEMTVQLWDEKLPAGINVDIDDQGRVIMFEVLAASRIFHPDLLAEWQKNLHG